MKNIIAVMLVWQFAVSSLSAQITYIWDYESLTALKSKPNSAEYQRIMKEAKGITPNSLVAVTQKRIIDARSLGTVLDCVRLVNSVRSIGKDRPKALVSADRHNLFLMPLKR